ncbi:hypothetical protein [Winogradskyella sp. 3972H.M.0a.05]|uniref:hypothetical protein n=1 Tax=Winogradskyella sp. 3972H.M.0a.05 TaxID=2950277 RepID=UPI003399C4D2
MNKLFSIVLSPFTPPMEEAFGYNFQLHAPYNDQLVTLLVDGNITDYIDEEKKQGATISQLVFNEHNEHSKVITLDFDKRNIVKLDNAEIKLINIDKVSVEQSPNQKFFKFEFLVTRNS